MVRRPFGSSRPLAVALLCCVGCVSERCISPYDKELDSLVTSEPIARVGDAELWVDAVFNYTRYEALSGRVPWVPTAMYSGGVFLRQGDPEVRKCRTSPDVYHPDGRPSCSLGHWSFDGEESWRAGSASFELESCSEGSRAAVRGSVVGEPFPPEGWFIVQIEGEEPRWLPSPTSASCADALAIAWSEAAATVEGVP